MVTGGKVWFNTTTKSHNPVGRKATIEQPLYHSRTVNIIYWLSLDFMKIIIIQIIIFSNYYHSTNKEEVDLESISLVLL